MKIARVSASLSVAVSLLLAGAGVALAEGGFNSSISGWLPGISSRDWADKNTDAVSTTVKLGGCRYDVLPGFSYATIQVSKRNGILPDQNMGRKSLYCSSSATGNWGRLGAATYRFTLTGINGSDRADDKFYASTVAVAY